MTAWSPDVPGGQAPCAAHASGEMATCGFGGPGADARASRARDAGVTAIPNPAPIGADLDPLLAALPHVITPNESEFALLLDHLHGQSLAPAWIEFPDTACCTCFAAAPPRLWGL